MNSDAAAAAAAGSRRDVGGGIALAKTASMSSNEGGGEEWNFLRWFVDYDASRSYFLTLDGETAARLAETSRYWEWRVNSEFELWLRVRQFCKCISRVTFIIIYVTHSFLFVLSSLFRSLNLWQCAFAILVYSRLLAKRERIYNLPVRGRRGGLSNFSQPSEKEIRRRRTQSAFETRVSAFYSRRSRTPRCRRRK